MPSYLALMNYTEQGIKGIKQGPQRIDAAKQAIQAAGGRLIFYYMLLGEYDLAALLEFPDDDTVARFLLSTGAQGNVRTHTMRAFTEEEARNLMAGLS